ncbi:hypothetical protein Tco_0309529 [Tanacetum coccineum]
MPGSSCPSEASSCCGTVDNVLGCPKVLADFVASAPLTPLLKPDNRIRPIAVGVIWRRLASKVAMRGVKKEMSKYLGDFQFGVGVPSGAEAVLHGIGEGIAAMLFHAGIGLMVYDLARPKGEEGCFPAILRKRRFGCDMKLLGGAGVSPSAREPQSELLFTPAHDGVDKDVVWSLDVQTFDHILQECGIDGADSDYGYALDRVRMSLPGNSS